MKDYAKNIKNRITARRKRERAAQVAALIIGLLFALIASSFGNL